MNHNFKFAAKLIIILCILFALFLYFWWNRNITPFASLQNDQIESVYVLLGCYPPYELSPDEQTALVEQLRKVVVHPTHKDPTEYDGVNPEQFLIKLRNGNEVYFASASPFFFVNDTVYELGYYGKDLYAASYAVDDFYTECVITHFLISHSVE